MKKLLLLFMGALLALPSMAQEEVDVTNYIQNAGFDEDLTFQTNGAMKEAVSTNTTLSDRSWAYIAADSTVYARPKSTSSQNRQDGRKMEAVNGFKGRIKGWTMESNAEFPQCEWTYFGSVPYDLKSQSVPVADDGSTYLEVPARPTEFDGGEGFVYLRAGWTNSAIYKQVVKLPCAVYRLEYWTININPNTSAVAADLTQIQCRKEVFKDEEGTGLNAQEWTKHEFEFTPTAEFTMQFGYQAANAGSGGQPIVALDGIKLYKIGEADPVEVLQAEITDLEDEMDELKSQAIIVGYKGLCIQIENYIDELEEVYDGENVDEMEAAVKQGEEMLAKFKKALDTIDAIDAILAKMQDIYNNPDYATSDEAKNTFAQAIEKLNELKTGNDNNVDYAELMLTAVENGKKAIREYLLSQKDAASEQNPVDFTFLIQHPWFINDDAEPVLTNGEWVFPKQYTINEETGEEVDQYKTGSASSPDLNSEGWYKAGADGGDQRLNWQQGRSCWNAWNNNFTTTLAVAQDFTDLPNGYYTVSADLITQSGYANETQHVYAQSTAGKKISQNLTSDGWIEGGIGEWETLATTAEEKVLVVDGKLTIGAEGTGDGNSASGWFLATNFHLTFLGLASEEEILAGLKESFDIQIADAKELAAAMHFAADKKVLNDSIANYEGAATKEAYIEALLALKTAVAEAEKSEAKYHDYLPTQETIDNADDPDALIASKTLLLVQELMKGDFGEHEAYSTESKPIVQFALDYVNGYIACDTATYKGFDAVVDQLKNYVNTYIPVFEDAIDEARTASEKGKAALQNVMNKQKGELTSEMKDKETVNAYVKELKEMMALVNRQNLYEENPNRIDYTEFIVNPNAEATDGWDFTMGNGDGNGEKSGQWMDDSKETRYFDSYSASGLKGFKFSQLIKGLPNGTYSVGLYARTPAEGAYVFYALENDTTFVEIPLDYYDVTNEETGEVTKAIASDKYGPVWEEAKKKVEDGLADEWDEAVYNANPNDASEGQGRGWKKMTMTPIKVENHELLIGSMTGTEESKTPKVFTGGWYSIGEWTLTLIEAGDNTNWGGPIESGITTVYVNNSNIADGIYTISGIRTNTLQRGVNIVVNNGKVRKVAVK